MSKRLETIEFVISKKPGDPMGWYAKAMELRSLGRHEDALVAYADVATKFPDYVPTYLMAAQLAHEVGRVDESRGWAERGLEQARKKGDAHALSELTSFLGTLS